MLGQRLEAQLRDAGDGIGRHVARQTVEWQRNTIAARQELIQNAVRLDYNNDDKLAGLADAHASGALALAEIDGVPAGPAIASALSSIWRSAIDQRLAAGQGAQALVLYERVKDRLAPADRRALDTPLEVARLDHATDQWIARQSPDDERPLQQRLDDDAELSPDARVVVRAKVEARESATESARVATVQALDDRVRATARTLATQPGAYAPGTLARIADGYAAAGEPDKAVAARRMALQEGFVRPFAQASVEKQQRLIDELPEGELRETAQAIQRWQADAFARDTFAAGTALYREVGAPVPIDDIAGRVRQARQIAQRRGGIAVAPFTVGEMDDMRRTLAIGSEAQKQAVRARLDVVPTGLVRPNIPLADDSPTPVRYDLEHSPLPPPFGPSPQQTRPPIVPSAQYTPWDRQSSDPPFDPTKLPEITSVIDGLWHWNTGGGEQAQIPFDKIDTRSVRPEQFEAVQEKLRAGKPGTYEVEGTKAFNANQTAFTKFVIGNMTLKIKGRLVIRDGGSYTFEGSLSAAPDRYDMDRAAHHNLEAQILTALGRFEGALVGHNDYVIHMPGQKPISSRQDITP